MNERVHLRGRFSEVEGFQRRLESRLREAGFSVELVHDLSLLAEEVLVNVIHHGYGGEGDAPLEVCLRVDEGRRVHLEFRDHAPPFDPLQAEERDPEEERLGGWGIPMLKLLSDRVSYARIGDQNVLALTRAERDPEPGPGTA